MKFEYKCEKCKKKIKGNHVDGPFNIKDSFECFKCGARLKVMDIDYNYDVHALR